MTSSQIVLNFKCHGKKRFLKFNDVISVYSPPRMFSFSSDVKIKQVELVKSKPCTCGLFLLTLVFNFMGNML